VVKGGQVLGLVNEDEGEPRERSAEQSGHVDLVVEVDVASVGRADRAEQDPVDEVAEVAIGLFLERVEELFLCDEAASAVGVWDPRRRD